MNKGKKVSVIVIFVLYCIAILIMFLLGIINAIKGNISAVFIILYALAFIPFAIWLIISKKIVVPIAALVFTVINNILLVVFITSDNIGDFLNLGISCYVLLSYPINILAIILLYLNRNNEVKKKAVELNKAAPNRTTETETTKISSEEKEEKEEISLMLSQYVAYSVFQDSTEHKDIYFRILSNLGFSEKEAQELFEFESEIIKTYDKKYLLHPLYCQAFLFNLKDSYFGDNHKKKEDILKDHFLAMSEICKIIDEAEWHYWNSHEENITDEIWAEIFQWRRKGFGGEFALKYFDMVSKQTLIPVEKIYQYSSHEGMYLSAHKWH